MSIKSKFSQDEWQMLCDGPDWVFAALAAADGNVALTTRMKESSAFKNVVKEYSGKNALVKEMIADGSKPSKDIKGATLSDAEQAIEEINEILNTKLDAAIANPYRDYLKSVADSVAGAAGEGALGLGAKVSKKEEKAISKIKAALKPAAAKAKAPAAKSEPVRKPSVTKTARPAARPAAKPAARPAARPAAKSSSASARPTASVSAEAATKATRRTVAGEASAASPQPPKPAEYLAEHTVASGETLSHVSLKYYNSAAKPKYMLIYEANKAVIGDNPNRISPGMVLKIPKLES